MEGNQIGLITKYAKGKSSGIDDVFRKGQVIDLTKEKPTTMSFFKKKEVK